MRLLLFVLTLFATAAAPAIEVRISVKYIMSFNGDRPLTPTDPGIIDISTGAAFEKEIEYGNRVLANAARGYTLRVVEYRDIQPPAPPGEPVNYWYNIATRDERPKIEAAALLNQGTWAWHTSALNIYVNNSSSGSCSFVGTGSSIALGASLFTRGTVLHEIGHFMNLRHTHAGDTTCADFNPVQPFSSYLADGDSLAETLPDHNCLTQDQLSQANFGKIFSLLTPQQQTAVNSSWLNVMSYHMESRLLPGQMDIWTDTANGPRQVWVGGKTYFVDRSNTCPASGLPPAYSNYAWWVETNPLPTPTPGASTPLSVTIDPPFPPRPVEWPSQLTWPPLDGTPKPPLYPGNWPWPPTDLPAVTFCLGGPLVTFQEGLQTANPGDAVTVRSGTYTAPARITKRVSIHATRGTVQLRR